MTYKEETIVIAIDQAEHIKNDFIAEVERLLKYGAIDPEFHSRGILFGVAIENIADGWISSQRKSKEYKNLKMF
jgi:hypothetical protein